MRRIALLACLAAASGSLTLAPSAAHAEIIGVGLISDPDFFVQAGAYGTGTGCSLSDPGSIDNFPLPLDGSTIKRTNTKSSTVTDGAGKIIGLNRSATASARVTTRGGQFASLDLSGTGFATADPQPGQACFGSTYTAGGVEFDFTLTKPQWVSFTLTSGRETEVYAEAYAKGSAGPSFYLESENAGGSVSGTQYLTAGTYEFDASVSWSAWTDVGKPGMDRNGAGSISLRLHDAGSAIAAPAGTGRSYLSPGPAINCSTASLPTTFTSRGGRVRSATFLVNGVQKRYVRNPVAGQKVTLTGLPKFRRNDVRVRLVVDPPGDVRTATVAVGRSYRACAPTF